ncbi:MAG: thiol-disulfide isomerase/thioredoxin [Rickettsiales bacterium]|jgi:thiol-disulfide isomerase/thioredoxin
MAVRLKIIFIIFAFFLNVNQSWSQDKNNLVIKDTKGKVFDLSEHKDKVVVVLYWASWCGPCKIEIVELDRIYDKYQSQGLEIIGLNLDGEVDDARNLKYPIAFSVDAKVNDFRIPVTLPTVYIVDKKGVSHRFYRPAEVKIAYVEKMVVQMLNS